MEPKAPGNKQYGLIVPKKNVTEIKRPSAFNEDSDSGEDAGAGTLDWIKKSYQKQAAVSSGGVRRQTQIDMKKALQQDSTVFQYDEIYDDMEKKKTEQVKLKTDDKKKPRYIQSLLRKAEQRKIENERRIERQVQKEREEEGETFKDKETFVTSAYKKKLEEFNKLDEEERRQDMLEDICDVSKQQDLGGFYRHLYRTTFDKKTEDTKDNEEDKKDAEKKPEEKVEKENKKPQKGKRQYRKRRNSESSSLEEGEHASDSDTNISSSSSDSSSSSSSSSNSSDSDAGKSKKAKKQGKTRKETTSKTKDIKDSKSTTKDEGNEKVGTSSDSNVVKGDNRTSQENEIGETKKPVNPGPKINIWEKRTVGVVFDAAVKRYFERKALKNAGPGN